jgi:hypothetical protein
MRSYTIYFTFGRLQAKIPWFALHRRTHDSNLKAVFGSSLANPSRYPPRSTLPLPKEKGKARLGVSAWSRTLKIMN